MWRSYSRLCSAGIFTALMLTVALLVFPSHLNAQQNDDSLIVVQAFTFDDEPTTYTNFAQIYVYDDLIDFPEPGGRYEKILIYYTLKCDASTKADQLACGEWDYSTWIRVWEDSTNHWEIGRFITPYGINLDLGPKGTTWIFDVTDYAPILNGTKRVTAGNSQELLDMKIVFIKGVPPRDPLSVTRLWSPGSHNYQKIVDDELLEPIEVALNPDAAMYRINTRPQGGNFNGGAGTDNCAEFCDREHWLTIDGTERFRWNVWNECGSNPVYPQGGTWVFDRAGWCPGDIVTTQHHELTPYVTPGETITIDYGIQNPAQFTPYGHWVFWADLVAYGEPNFESDASLEAIIAPNDFLIYGRSNPVCSAPVIRIRNTGTDPLSALDIEYGIKGQETRTWTWNGALEFLEEATVELPVIPLDEWEAGSNTFVVRIKNPNGVEDEYERNNYAESTFELPPTYPGKFDIHLMTNAQAALQYEWSLADADGMVIQSGSNLQDNTEYVYPVDLPEGCYTFRLKNREGYGLDFFAVRQSLGTGSVRFALGSGNLKVFNPDFGNEIYHQFRVGAVPLLSVSSDTLGFGKVEVGSSSQQVFEIRPSNSAGLEVRQLLLLSGGSSFKLDSIVPGLQDGPVTLEEGDVLRAYFTFTPADTKDYSGRLVLQTNDFRGGTASLFLAGTGDVPVGVAATLQQSAAPLALSVHPSSVRDQATITVGLHTGRTEQVSLKLVNVTGQTLQTLLSEPVPSGDHRVLLDTDGLASGTYYLVLQSETGMIAEEVKVVR